MLFLILGKFGGLAEVWTLGRHLILEPRTEEKSPCTQLPRPSLAWGQRLRLCRCLLRALPAFPTGSRLRSSVFNSPPSFVNCSGPGPCQELHGLFQVCSYQSSLLRLVPLQLQIVFQIYQKGHFLFFFSFQKIKYLQRLYKKKADPFSKDTEHRVRLGPMGEALGMGKMLSKASLRE